MAETTIEWTATRLRDGTVLPGYTFNGWEGCEKVSPGCKHCYAETRDKRLHGGDHWGPNGTRLMHSDAYWRRPLAWDREAAASGIRRKVFCASLSDVFEDRPELVEPRARLFALICETPHLDWLLLTKRPENAQRLWLEAEPHLHPTQPPSKPLWRGNVWLGTTVEDQQRADERIPHLLAVPAAVRFLSVEPLLGQVDLSRWIAPVSVCGEHEDEAEHDGSPNLCPSCGRDSLITLWGEEQIEQHRNGLRYSDEDGNPRAELRDGPEIHWVIAGGESGRGARPMHPEWVRSLRDQCANAGVPFLFKQWGEYCPRTRGLEHGPMDRVGKKAAGRVFDGCTHDAFPEVQR